MFLLFQDRSFHQISVKKKVISFLPSFTLYRIGVSSGGRKLKSHSSMASHYAENHSLNQYSVISIDSKKSKVKKSTSVFYLLNLLTQYLIILSKPRFLLDRLFLLFPSITRLTFEATILSKKKLLPCNFPSKHYHKISLKIYLTNRISPINNTEQLWRHY